MAIAQEVERLDTGDTEGCKYRGYIREVISGKENGTTPYILKVEESGALCVHGAAAGPQWELPPAGAGVRDALQARVAV